MLTLARLSLEEQHVVRAAAAAIFIEFLCVLPVSQLQKYLQVPTLTLADAAGARMVVFFFTQDRVHVASKEFDFVTTVTYSWYM